MRRLIVIAMLAVFVTACAEPAEVVVQSAGSSDMPSGISVTGTGRVSGAPDVLTVDVGVSVLRDTVSVAVADASSLAEAVVGALTDNGVEERDIQTTNYSIYPEYDYSGQRQRIVGYRVSNLVTAKVRDIDGAGTLLDAVAAAGGDDVQINGVRFDLEDNEQLLQAAREAAWADARAKAEQLAELSGVALQAPTAIREGISSPPPVVFATDAPAAEESVTPIQAGELEVQVTLEVQFGVGG